MTLVLDKLTKPRVKQWSKREYNELVELGAFRNQRVYLLRGEVIEMPPMGAAHAQCLRKVANWLYATFRPQWEICIQMPFDVPGPSMPEPDAAVMVPEDAMRLPHPAAAVLIIEISDSSIDLDRAKALEYAAAGVPEYWIVNLNARLVEVYRAAVPDGSAASGFRYSINEVAGEKEYLSTLAKPAETKIQVADLLP